MGRQRTAGGWATDAAVAFGAGLVLGAPVTLAVYTATGAEALVTPTLVGAMAAVLAVLRRTASRRSGV